MPYYKKKSRSWTAQWQISGKRSSKDGFSSKRNAEIFESQQFARAEKRLLGQEDFPEISLEDLFAKFIEDGKRRKREKSYKRDVSSLRIWLDFFEQKGVFYAHHVSQAHLSEFLDWRLSRPISSGKYPSTRTVNLDMITLRAAFGWAAKRGILPQSPLKDLPLFKQASQSPRYLTLDELSLVENIAKTEGKIWEEIFVLARTGMRSGELCSLKISNANLEKRQIILRPEQTKANMVRIIPFGKEVGEVLARLIGESKEKGIDFVFCTRSGSKQTPKNLFWRFRCVLKQAQKQGMDISRVNVHTLRKTYISHLVMAGVEPVKVMEIVGHREWATMRRYLALAPGYLQNVQDKLPY